MYILCIYTYVGEKYETQVTWRQRAPAHLGILVCTFQKNSGYFNM